jgi:hypothetical protein
MKKQITTAAAVAALAMLSQSQSVQAHVATIDGGYDSCSFDTPCLIFHNTSLFPFTGAQMVLLGYQGLNNGVAQTVSLGTLGVGDTSVVWGTGGPLFVNDYDDSQGGPGPCPPNPINSGLCAIVGNFSVTFTATWNGNPIFSVFSPTTNATGGFVPWEGLNTKGQSEDPCCDVHGGTVGGTLAFIDVGTPPTVPEPATLSLLGASLAALGLLRRRKAK